ncbi:Rieske 2Fe-2S domain-containing protein [Novosphingobium sp. G106]|uniref:Rieske 2Fe-2S domain-containing protein n=1 Tax=Novosphingobium sp. G106 TaxID=2849500 RepID=UPI001C2DC9F5|nr:Rieske 2Fe-2S domain-containing protein [Novosphingobium sp. G106]MBV1687310.1 Rieske 2Fe-2S domain-containing protein [Novosphingobium sp. G106]
MDAATSPLDRGYAKLPIPFGWFAVAMSGDIAPGEVKTLRYFSTEFVMWRGEDGAVHVVDPYCPHLGAHLGVGGEVVGNDLRCPFHHWSFNGQGAATDIPYTDVIPPQAKRADCLPTWPVTESDGVIYVWYHPKKAAPKWDVSRLPECPDGDWILHSTYDWVINIHIQEITENGQDHAHFGAVHGVPFAPKGEFKLEGWTRRNTVVAEMNTPRGPMTGKIDTTAVGPGQSMVEYIDVCHVVQAQQVTAIDPEHTHLRWQMFTPPGISEGKARVTQARIRDLVKQVNQDIPIWNAKRFMEQPMLVKGDGPMIAYRRQYAKFYDFDAPEPDTIAA